MRNNFCQKENDDVQKKSATRSGHTENIRTLLQNLRALLRNIRAHLRNVRALWRNVRALFFFTGPDTLKSFWLSCGIFGLFCGISDKRDEVPGKRYVFSGTRDVAHSDEPLTRSRLPPHFENIIAVLQNIRALLQNIRALLWKRDVRFRQAYMEKKHNAAQTHWSYNNYRRALQRTNRPERVQNIRTLRFVFFSQHTMRPRHVDNMKNNDDMENKDRMKNTDMGWLPIVGSLKLWVSFAEYCLFYAALSQKRPIILRSPLIVAIP